MTVLRPHITLYAIFSLLALSTLPLGAQQRMTIVHGIPGVASKHAVANFIDLAQQERLHPPVKKRKIFPEPEGRPGRFIPRSPVSGEQAEERGREESAPRRYSAAPVEAPLAPRLQLSQAATKSSLAEIDPRFVGKSRAPGLSESFQALLDDGTSIPPDTQGAVGPSHVMTTLNSQVSIQTKTGSSVSTISLNGFFSKVLPNGNDCFDPHCYYDMASGRFIFSTDSAVLSNTTNNVLLLAVSQTSDPTKSWDFYSVTTDATNATWVDFPILGFNANWIVLSGNVFDNSTGNFNKDVIYAFNKANVLSGGSGSYTTLSDTTGGFAVAPAIEIDNTATEYLLDDWAGDNAQSQGQLRLSTITGSVGHESLTLGTAYPSVSAPWSDTDPGDFAPQLGSSQKINTGDSRLYEVVLNNGTLWTAHTINLPAITPTRSAVQWWQVTTGGSILQVGRLDDPTATVFRAYPSLAVNSQGDVLMGYSEFSASIYASAYYTYRTPTDAPNTMEPEALLKAGEAPYYKTFGGFENRWGDYSNTVLDPSDGLTMWTIQEYAASPFTNGDSRWGTWWGAVPAPAISAVPNDFNGDGIPDLLFQNASSGQIAAWFMNGAIGTSGGGFITPTQNPAWHVVGDGDFNGDGHPDILFQNPSTGQLALWIMNGTQATNGFLLPNPPSGWNAVGINNFGNGTSDVLFQSSATGQLAVWFFTGTAPTNGAYITNLPPAGWKAVGTGDFNGDGKPDIVLQNPSTGQLAVWFMNGTTVTGASYVTPNQSAAWKCVAVLDLNKDGKPDLVFQNSSTGQIAYWIMNGVKATTGGFLPSQSAGWQVVGPR